MKNIKLNYKNTALINNKQISSTAKKLGNYIAHLNKVAKDNNYDFWESSINLPFDNKLVQQVKRLVKKQKSKNLKYIIVIGIGGSNLGTKAVYEALYDSEKKQLPKILFADTVSPALLKTIQDILKNDVKNAGEVCLNLITKSGTTTEPIANFEIVYGFLKKRLGKNIKDRVVVTTSHKSTLWNMAQKRGFLTLNIPEKVGGRYSVFSAVGLFPLALAGVDIDELLGGARMVRNQCLKNNIKQNLALASAILTYLHNKKGIKINNNFFFNPELESVGKWYRQLMGESIGKEKNISGRQVYAGITPVVSIGSTDLHSMAQLYFGGPRDKFTSLVYSQTSQPNVKVPAKTEFANLVDGIAGKDAALIMDAIYGGVKKAYQNNKLPFTEVILPEISAYAIGQYLQFKMIEMMFLAKLLSLNAFDQPNVEDYKKETRKLLAK
jgi:glucose-6-phosphate isomerase